MSVAGCYAWIWKVTIIRKQKFSYFLILFFFQDLKRQAEMTKLERKHEHTRAVLRRKADEVRKIILSFLRES